MNFLADLFDRPIAFHPALVPVTGSVNAALMLGQAVYWSKRTKGDGWFYKTQAEWQEEIALSRKEQENAREKLRERGFMEEELRGVPAKLHFRVNFDQLARFVQSSMPQTDILDCPNGAHKSARHGHTITETTQRLRTETTYITPTPQGVGSFEVLIDADGNQASPEIIIAVWNSLPKQFPKEMMPPTPQRRAQIEAALRSTEWLNSWREVIRLLPNVPVTRGENSSRWVADMDAFLMDGFAREVIEGRLGRGEAKKSAKKEKFSFEESCLVVDKEAPGILKTTEMMDAWQQFYEHRNTMKGSNTKLTEKATKMIAQDFAKWGPKLSVIAIRDAIKSGWRGIFAPKGQFSETPIKTVPLRENEVPKVANVAEELRKRGISTRN